MRWIYPDLDTSSKASELSSLLSVHPVLASLLVSRGVHSFDEARSFFRPTLDMLHDPFEMADMQRATDRLVLAIERDEKILVYGDYDVDGTTSVAMFYYFLTSFYPNCEYYIPDRYKEGYGVSDKAVEFASAEGFSLIITLDCGIKAHRQIQNGGALGIDFIVCDHHTPASELPEACAILDPKRTDCTYPYKELSGCGVGFKFIQAFCELHPDIPIDPYNLLDLVAVSIASDIVQITGENRVLAFYGLRKLAAAPRPGLEALMRVAGITPDDISIMRVVFGLAPRINAAGRLQDAKYAVRLMLASDKRLAEEMAGNLDVNNNERRELDKHTTEEALAMIEAEFMATQSTVLYNPEWHKGIIGIVASRCIESYYRPTVILTESANGLLAGSARSVDGFDVYHALEQCADHLEQFGGHKYAAGMTLKVSQLPAFRNQFEQVVTATILPEQREARLEIDAQIELREITPKFYRILRQIAPFGPGNTEPVFSAQGLIAENIRSFSSRKNPASSHLKFRCRQGVETWECIGFNMGHFAEDLRKSQTFSMAFVVTENNYRGKTELQLQVKDIISE